MKSRSGFTIVELLVVIVVIGILATISVAAYSGIQERARNASLLSAMDALEKGLRLYVSEHGEYIRPTDLADPYNKYICLQPTSGGWPVRDGMTSSQCTSSAAISSEYSTAVRQEFSEVIGKIPDTSDITLTTSLSGNAISTRGVLYQYISAPAGGWPNGLVALVYFIKDDQTCGRGIKTSQANLTVCQVLLN